ncbi:MULTISPECIES: ATP-binding protein [Subtercola]|uniref:GNAT family N-acetyltransferase n=1 Tax=Subtercola vilae TaxID=2056433 RepID=A0A4T2C5S7_9MICO|nr:MULTISPECIES: GNAT family N-acetyltransferase [Subtercola]MEA9984154.1 GNAT family N-acetyltransferase [Subtercola sp. RTI3]TIH38631.1 GNAT family N-acetyltransferase [Subtercola vilae]
MTNVRIRDFHPDDIDSILRLWEDMRRAQTEPVYSLPEVLASCQQDHAVVAVLDDVVIGAAVGRAAHAQGWIVFLSTAPAYQRQGVGGALLAALEKRMAPLGLSKLSVLLPETTVPVDAFSEQGFETKKNLLYLERRIPVQRNELSALSELGGRVLPRGLWTAIGGMQKEKELLERRLVMPLANSDLAEQFGVVPPSAVVLFGPPGTGKTTFARAIASRLEWSFVEVFPSRLASDPAGLAGALRETFTKIADLEHAVVFIDEVEEIAVQRGGEPPSAMQGVTNELLKIIPTFRDQPNRLLVCATNFIRSLDTAFLRHGRFDYVIPIGLPDEDARESIWARYIPAQALAGIDLGALVERTEGFSPADIEYAARKASQSALEKALYPERELAAISGPSTADYLAAIGATRATVSAEVAQAFLEDIESIARL